MIAVNQNGFVRLVKLITTFVLTWIAGFSFLFIYGDDLFYAFEPQLQLDQNNLVSKTLETAASPLYDDSNAAALDNIDFPTRTAINAFDPLVLELASDFSEKSSFPTADKQTRSNNSSHKQDKQNKIKKADKAITQVAPSREIVDKQQSTHQLKSIVDHAEVKEILQVDTVQANKGSKKGVAKVPSVVHEMQVIDDAKQVYVQSIGFTGDVYHFKYGVEETFVEKSLEEALEILKIELPAKLLPKDLQSIGFELSSSLRKNGLVFNTVMLDSQKASVGHVKFKVNYGVLADIKVYGNRNYKVEQIVEPFKNLLGRPIYGPSVKVAAQKLKRYSGLKTFSYYSRGMYPGEVRLNIRVTEEKETNHYVDLDNYGAEETGKARVSYLYEAHNLFGYFGQSNFMLTTTETLDSFIGFAQYLAPVYKYNSYFTLQAASSTYQVGGDFDSLELSGRVLTTSLTYSPWDELSQKPLFDYADYVDSLSISFNYTTLGSDLPEFSIFEESSSYFKITLDPSTHLQYRKNGWSGFADLKLSYGYLTINEERSVDDHFFLLEGASVFSYTDRNTRLFNELGIVKFNWNTRFQLTPNAVPSAETFTMTGFYGVSGYTAGLFSPHSGVYSSFTIDSKSRRIGEKKWELFYKPSLFLDLSYGLDNILSKTLSDNFSEGGFIGGGSRLIFQLYGDVFVSAQLSVPLYSYGNSTIGSNEVDDFQLYIAVKYRL